MNRSVLLQLGRQSVRATGGQSLDLGGREGGDTMTLSTLVHLHFTLR